MLMMNAISIGLIIQLLFPILSVRASRVYQASGATNDWHVANQRCTEQGSALDTLATIYTDDDYEALKEEKDNAEPRRRQIADGVPFWVGLYQQEAMGDFMWIDGAPCETSDGLCVSDWLEIPDLNTTDEYCVTLTVDIDDGTRGYDAVSCDQDHPYICGFDNGTIYQETVPADANGKTFTIDCGPREIRIVSATYGLNCGQIKDNVGFYLVFECDGKQICDYTVENELIGDPAPGCDKTFEYEYECIVPTASPTKAPTDEPTTSPTDAPTDEPTKTPTDEPTEAPVTPSPVTPSPVTPAPVTPAPITPSPVTPAPVTPAPVTPAPVTPAPNTPSPTTPAPVTPSPVTPSPTTASPTRSGNPFRVYHVSGADNDWHVANQNCIELSSDDLEFTLATIDTDEDYEALKQAKDNVEPQWKQIDDDVPFWVGLYREEASTDFIWTDGTPCETRDGLCVSDWLEIPDLTVGTEYCVTLTVDSTDGTRGYEAVSCDQDHPYICSFVNGTIYKETVPAEANLESFTIDCGRNVISIVSATYGLNCGEPKDNVGFYLVFECDGKNTCDYTVESELIGDPAPGCDKTFEYEYECNAPPTEAPTTPAPTTPEPTTPEPTTPAPVTPSPVTPAPVTPEPTGGAGYEYLGCFKDKEERALRYGPGAEGGAIYDIDLCSIECVTYEYFALENYGECFCETSYAKATQYGDGNKGRNRCPDSQLGGRWRLDLFRHTDFVGGEVLDDDALGVFGYQGKYSYNYVEASRYTFWIVMILLAINCICFGCYVWNKNRGSRYYKVQTIDTEDECL